MKKLIFLIVLVPFFARATNYYIANAGSNSNNGTSKVTPFQTTSKLSSVTLNPGDSVLWNCGDVFYGSVPVNFSGTSTQYIIYGSYGSGAQPIITGLITISGWTSIGGGKYEAACTGCKLTNNTFMVNSNMGYIGRTPNSIYNTMTGYTLTKVFDGTMATNHTGSGIGVRSSHFTIDLGTVQSQSGDTMTISPALSFSGQNGTGYFFYNNISDLDSIGEYIMRHAGDSIMGFFGGSGPGGLTTTASNIDTLVYCTKSYVKFINLNFQGGNLYTFFSNGGTGVQTSNCTVQYNGMNGVTFYNTTLGVVMGCSVLNSNSNGITIFPNCPYMSILNNIVDRSGMKAGMGQAGNNGSYEGISNSNLNADPIIMFNVVTNSGYTAVSFNGDSAIVEFNNINGFCSVKDDGGGAYSWVGGNPSYPHRPQVKFNIIQNGYSTPLGVNPDATITACGVYLDSHTAFEDVMYNTIINCTTGIFDHGPSNKIDSNDVWNNLFAQIEFQEVNDGVFITSIECQGNNLSAANNNQKLMVAATWSTDLNLFGTLIDHNSYLIPAGSNTAFFTKSSTDNGTNRTLAGFTTNIGYETHSTLLNANPIILVNPTNSPANVTSPGKYTDGITIWQGVVPVGAFRGKTLQTLNVGYFILQTGSPIHINF